jgi:(1->4)-alpha-D-glucan 1-alpha-D-glucosylmutase
VQLHGGFAFDDAARLAPDLAELGISHLYCSPVLQAAAGSTHGYDVVDHGRLNEELGGEAGFRRMVQALQEQGLSVLLDTVPNHMAVAGRDNAWWWDVLEDGPSSLFADHFDIDWAGTDTQAGPSVLMPILGDHYGRVLEAGGLRLRFADGAFTVTYEDHELPLSPRSVDHLLAEAAVRCGSSELASIAEDTRSLPHAALTDASARRARHDGKQALRRRLAELSAAEPSVQEAIEDQLRRVSADPDQLDHLLRRQSYRLAHWRVADEEVDYRRFFNIASLVGLRVEEPRVFDETHRLLASLVASGEVTGLRIDHVDGLRDPAGYLRRLHELMPGAYLVVEKILRHGGGPDGGGEGSDGDDGDEHLPSSWPVAGTSGYDALIRINDLFVDSRHEDAHTAAYQRFTGDERTFRTVEREGKHHVMAVELAAEVQRLSALAGRICARHRRHRDHTRSDIRIALTELLASMGVYRTYVVPGEVPTASDQEEVESAVAAARAHRPDIDAELLSFLGRVLLLEVHGEEEHELASRFQQVSAPVMAKGVEDTAFYRYNRLVSLNEVGGDPGTFGTDPGPFHRHNARAARCWPATMATLSTHDTKRSADVRARIDLLSELPEPWALAVERWAAHNRRHRSEAGPDPATEYAVYQTLVGTWPITLDRLGPAMDKAAKEAKVHTSWNQPDPSYDSALQTFLEEALADEGFLADLEAFLAEHRIVERGRITSLAQTALLLTVPGVPDVYQGTELWDHSLVDPDNRRPVDHDQRARLLAALRDATAEDAQRHLDDGGTKLWMVRRLLQHRRAVPERYRARGYEPVAATGPTARHVVAFRRHHQRVERGGHAAPPAEGGHREGDEAGGGGLLVVVPRLLVGLAEDWAGTTVTAPAGAWRDVLTGAPLPGGQDVPLVRVFERFPVAVLAEERS